MSTLEKNLNKCHIGILSKGRPKNIFKSIYETINSQATWYVSSGKEMEEYTDDFIELKIQNKPLPSIAYGGKLVESRNRIIDDAVYFGKQYAVILEDDLTNLNLAVDKKQKMKMAIPQAIDMMITTLENMKFGDMICNMVGVAPTANSFYFNPDKPISLNKFCVGSLLVIDKSTPLRFDPNMTLKEDYDYTLQHIKHHGIVARMDNILASFSHYSNKGGVVGYRNTLREQQNINYLKKKWGYLIKDNPRRPNEILLARIKR